MNVLERNSVEREGMGGENTQYIGTKFQRNILGYDRQCRFDW